MQQDMDIVDIQTDHTDMLTAVVFHHVLLLPLTRTYDCGLLLYCKCLCCHTGVTEPMQWSPFFVVLLQIRQKT